MSQKGRSLIKAAFDTDNFLMRISEKVLDIVTVNLLFVVTCLPIVTIGVSKISLYQTMFEIKQSRRVPVFRTYLRVFRQNLKLGFQLGMLELGIVFLTLSDLYLFWGQTALPFQLVFDFDDSISISLYPSIGRISFYSLWFWTSCFFTSWGDGKAICKV